MLSLTRKIIRAMKKRGLITAFIYGEYGDGKTSFSLHVAQEVFAILYKLSGVDAWLMALDHLYFDPKQALLFIELQRRERKGRVPLIIMDDVGQHLSRIRWWMQDVVEFREWMGVARTDCAAIIFTAPTNLSLPSGIIDQCFRRIHVRKDAEQKGMSEAKGYRMALSPMFQQMSVPEFIDTFPTHYPDYVFERYEEMREQQVSPLRRSVIARLGLDKTMEVLSGLGATQKVIGEIVGKDNSTVSKRLKKLRELNGLKTTH